MEFNHPPSSLSEGGNARTQIRAARLYLDPTSDTQGYGFWTGKLSPKGTKSPEYRDVNMGTPTMFQERAEKHSAQQYFEEAPVEDEETIKALPSPDLFAFAKDALRAGNKDGYLLAKGELERRAFIKNVVHKAIGQLAAADRAGSGVAHAGRGHDSVQANKDRKVFDAIHGTDEETSTRDKDEHSVEPAEEEDRKSLVAEMSKSRNHKAYTRKTKTGKLVHVGAKGVAGPAKKLSVQAARELLDEALGAAIAGKLDAARSQRLEAVRAFKDHDLDAYSDDIASQLVERIDEHLNKAIGTKPSEKNERPVKRAKAAPTAKVGSSKGGKKTYDYRKTAHHGTQKVSPSKPKLSPTQSSAGPVNNDATLEVNPERFARAANTTVEKLQRIADTHDEEGFISFFRTKGASLLGKHKVPNEYLHSVHGVLKRQSTAKAEKPFHGYNPKRHARTGGLSAEGRRKMNRETGSKLKAPVTEKAPTGKRAARRRSFCARMKGVKGPTSREGKLTPKGAALKRWRCKSFNGVEYEWDDDLLRGFSSADLARELAYAKVEADAVSEALIREEALRRSDAPWEKPAPKGKSKPLSPSKKAKAKARAKAAGRPYPNLIDNMAAAKSGKTVAVSREHLREDVTEAEEQIGRLREGIKRDRAALSKKRKKSVNAPSATSISFTVDPSQLTKGSEERAFAESLVVSGVNTLPKLATFLRKGYAVSATDAVKSATQFLTALKAKGAVT